SGRPAHSPIHMSTAIRQWRGFKAATRLGWQISSNWTQPLVFVLYSVLRPLSAAFILVVMYRVISGGGANTAAYLAFLVSGVAFWSFVQYGFAGLSNGIAEDRGEYKMLKYVYTSPAHFYVYLLGRGLAQLASAVASALIVLIVATIALGLPINPLHINYPLLLGASSVRRRFGCFPASRMAMSCCGCSLPPRRRSSSRTWSSPGRIGKPGVRA